MGTDNALPPLAARALASWRWPDWSSRRLARRLRAVGRLVARRRRAWKRFEDLQHLDERTLRDLGVTRSEIGSIVSELGGHAAVTRRRADLEVWSSAPSRFRNRAIDSSL